MIELICSSVCGFVCFVHCVFSLIHARRTNKKIDRICEKCGCAVVENEEHSCNLNAEQLTALTVFLSSLRGDKNG